MIPEQHPPWLEELDHTADAGIIVRAGDVPELFARAAWGMFSIITEVATVRPLDTRRVVLAAGDRAELMVKWLSELNYLHVTGHLLFSKFDIRRITDTELEADVSGERTDRERHSIYTEIKAVTFHGLEIEQLKERWKAQIIFDL